MEVIEMSEMLLLELTVNQYIGLICTILGVLVGLFIIVYTIYHLVNLILDYVIYCFRKDKYKSLNFAAMRAYRQIEADERVSQTYPQEERSEINPNK